MSTDDRMNADTQRFTSWAQEADPPGATPVIPAATVVVLRDTDDGPAILMLRRNSRIAFGGMWVFPGGRIDLEDRSGNSRDELTAARVAAAREAMEEASVEVHTDEMVFFAHWLPPTTSPKRFSTWFFAVAVDSARVRIDQGEIVADEWMTPERALQRHHEGEIELVPPTWVTLHTLSGFDTVSDALAALENRPARYHQTRIDITDNGPVAMWKGDSGYDTNDSSITGSRHRLEMFENGYVYDDSGAVQ